MTCIYLYYIEGESVIPCTEHNHASNTKFTQMQEDSNLQQPPQKNMSAKGKCIYPNLRRPPRSKMSAKKKYFTINFMHLIHKDTKHIRFYLYW